MKHNINMLIVSLNFEGIEKGVAFTFLYKCIYPYTYCINLYHSNERHSVCIS